MKTVTVPVNEIVHSIYAITLTYNPLITKVVAKGESQLNSSQLNKQDFTTIFKMRKTIIPITFTVSNITTSFKLIYPSGEDSTELKGELERNQIAYLD